MLLRDRRTPPCVSQLSSRFARHSSLTLSRGPRRRRVIGAPLPVAATDHCLQRFKLKVERGERVDLSQPG